MKLFNLGYVDWLDSQLLYHAEPRVDIECLNILAPREPYVCIGVHQDLEQEVDIEACRKRNLPVFRREVGGGAVFLDGRQIFFQLVLHKDNPAAAGTKEVFYKRLLEPVAQTYTDLGVPAKYKPVNDVLTEDGRKISGTGVAEIEDYLILVGNLIADFDYDTMSKILRVPDEKYRDKVYKSMKDNLTTLKRETGHDFTLEELAGPLIKRFSEVLGPMEEADIPETVRSKAEELLPMYQSEEWLYKRGKRSRQERELRISGDVNVNQRIHKAPGGLIRSLTEIKQGRFESVRFSGDFFCYPREAVGTLEKMLEGVSAEEASETIDRFYSSRLEGRNIETPGIVKEDWLKVLGAL